MKFAELSDAQWDFIKPHLPPQPIVGRKRANDRKTINGILYVLITGCRWEDMPRCYGAYQTAWRRHKRWSEEGIWNKILVAAQEQAYIIGKLSLETVAVDSTLIDSKKAANLSDTTDISAARE
jgi:transposase